MIFPQQNHYGELDNTQFKMDIASLEWYDDQHKTEAVIHEYESVFRVLKRCEKQVDGQLRCWVFYSGKYSERKMLLYLYHPTRTAKMG